MFSFLLSFWFGIFFVLIRELRVNFVNNFKVIFVLFVMFLIFVSWGFRIVGFFYMIVIKFKSFWIILFIVCLSFVKCCKVFGILIFNFLIVFILIRCRMLIWFRFIVGVLLIWFNAIGLKIKVKIKVIC